MRTQTAVPSPAIVTISRAAYQMVRRTRILVGIMIWP